MSSLFSYQANLFLNTYIFIQFPLSFVYKIKIKMFISVPQALEH